MMAALLYGAGGLALASTCARVLMRQPAESEARRYGGVDAESWVLCVLCVGGVLLLLWASRV
jgi:ABC-type Fe3+-siderophore transport system permease subunit